MRRGIAFAGAVLAVAGCATAPTTLQTARTTEEGELRFHAGGSIAISSRFVSEVADLVDGATDRAEMAEEAGRPLTPEEERELEEGALGLILFASAPVFELGARYGVVEDFDVGFRWAGPMLRADGKVRFLEQPDLQLSGMLGYTYHTSTAPSIMEELQDLFDFVAVIDYSRHDLDLTLLASGDPESAVSWYASLRYLAGFVSVETTVGYGTMISSYESDEVMHVIAGTGGMRIGSEKVQLLLELMLGYVLFSPAIDGEEFDLSGVLIMPAIGLAFETG